ncbi:MAG: hydantoinase B/oxoprolinase family protein, partial [Bacillota bacterium]
MTKVDIITEEVVRNYLITVAEEMKKTIIRTSMSPIIYEVLDFST